MPLALPTFAIGVPLASTIETDPIWPSVLDALKERIPVREAQTLVWKSRFLRRTEYQLPALVSDGIVHDWIRNGWLEYLRQTVSVATQGRLELAVCPVRDKALAGTTPHRSLDGIVASDANAAALGEIHRVAAAIPGSESTLVLSGPAGTGKSHLLLALASASAARGRRVLYVPAESFTLAVLEAAQRKTRDTLRAVLGGAELVIVDGLERLAGRDGSQRMLLYVLDRCHEGQLSVALGASRSPAAQKGLSDALLERLGEAREVAIGAPDAAARAEIVRRRIASWGVRVHPAACSWLADELEHELGSLDVMLTRVLTHPAALEGPEDADTLRRRLRQRVGSTTRRAALPPNTILEQTARHFNVRPLDLRGPGRSPRLTLPRQIAMYLLRRHSGLSYPEIGRRMRRHHTTAMHACKRVDVRRQQDANLRTALGVLEKELARLGQQQDEVGG